jgi:hypothetical protein
MFMDSIIQKYLTIELIKSITNTTTYENAINKTFIE